MHLYPGIRMNWMYFISVLRYWKRSICRTLLLKIILRLTVRETSIEALCNKNNITDVMSLVDRYIFWTIYYVVKVGKSIIIIISRLAFLCKDNKGCCYYTIIILLAIEKYNTNELYPYRVRHYNTWWTPLSLALRSIAIKSKVNNIHISVCRVIRGFELWVCVATQK